MEEQKEEGENVPWTEGTKEKRYTEAASSFRLEAMRLHVSLK